MNTFPSVACSDPPEVPRPGRQTIPQPDKDRTPTTPKRSLHILCIDDDALILEITKNCLTHFEHRVRVASGGKYGIELFCTAILESEPYDVVITDLGMPDMNGYQVARTIKTESPTTPIVMMTGGGTIREEAGDRVSAVNVVIGKPPRMKELNEMLLRLVG